MAGTVHAEVTEVRISKGYGITYLPVYVMDHEKLLEKHAKAAGLGDVKLSWHEIDGGGNIMDAMIASALEVAGIGTPGFLTLWSKTKGNAAQEILGISSICGVPMWLNTNNPNVKTLRDFTEKDRIAVPGVKTSLAAVMLHMMVAKEMGIENYAKLDPLTVTLLHPDAYNALASGKTEITAHLASPPFSFVELKLPGVRKLASSSDILGNIHIMTLFAQRRFTEANPKLMAAFIAALDEANAIIAEDKARAAQIYVKASKVKVSEAEMVAMISDKDMSFGATPRGFMNIASFMHKAGSIKNKPTDWKELFVAAMHGRPGS